jgi:hypothetical protein
LLTDRNHAKPDKPALSPIVANWKIFNRTYDALLQRSWCSFLQNLPRYRQLLLRRELAMNQFDTHEVFNQAPPFAGVNLFECDPALRKALAREGGGWAARPAGGLGARLGRAEVLDLARLANAIPRAWWFRPPGRRIDEVEFHPAWHELMA